VYLFYLSSDFLYLGSVRSLFSLFVLCFEGFVWSLVFTVFRYYSVEDTDPVLMFVPSDLVGSCDDEDDEEESPNANTNPSGVELLNNMEQLDDEEGKTNRDPSGFELELDSEFENEKEPELLLEQLLELLLIGRLLRSLAELLELLLELRLLDLLELVRLEEPIKL